MGESNVLLYSPMSLPVLMKKEKSPMTHRRSTHARASWSTPAACATVSISFSRPAFPGYRQEKLIKHKISTRFPRAYGTRWFLLSTYQKWKQKTKEIGYDTLIHVAQTEALDQHRGIYLVDAKKDLKYASGKFSFTALLPSFCWLVRLLEQH